MENRLVSTKGAEVKHSNLLRNKDGILRDSLYVIEMFVWSANYGSETKIYLFENKETAYKHLSVLYDYHKKECIANYGEKWEIICKVKKEKILNLTDNIIEE